MVVRSTSRYDHDLPRRAALYGLRDHIDKPLAQHLVRLLREAPQLWREIASALVGRGGQLVVDELQKILAHAPEVRSRRGAARALALENPRWSRAQPAFDDSEEHPLFGYEDSSGVSHPTG